MFHYSPYASAYPTPRLNSWDGYSDSFDHRFPSTGLEYAYTRPIHRGPPASGFFSGPDFHPYATHEARVAHLRAELAAAEEEERIAHALYLRRKEMAEQQALREAIEHRRREARAFEEVFLRNRAPNPHAFGPTHVHSSPSFHRDLPVHLGGHPHGHRFHRRHPEPTMNDFAPAVDQLGQVFQEFMKALVEETSEEAPKGPSPRRASCCAPRQTPPAAEPAKAERKDAPAAPDFHSLLGQFLGGATNNDQNPLNHLMSQFLGPDAARNFSAAFAPEQPVAGPSGTSSSSSSGSSKKPLTTEEHEKKEIEEAIRLSLETESASEPEPEGKGKAKDVVKDTSEASLEDIRASLTAIDTAEASFRSLTQDFDFPLHLDFKVTPASSRPSSPVSLSSKSIIEKVSFSPNNAPVLHLHEGLSEVIRELKEVPVFDKEHVAKRRQEVLSPAEEKLEEIEREIEGRWKSWESKNRKKVTIEEVEDEEAKSDWSDVDGVTA